MFRLGLLSQIILPHPPDSPRDKLTTFSAFIHELKKNGSDFQADLERRTKKVETGVNTDTVELLRQLDGSPVMVDISTQTPVEFYFQMDFDLYGSLEMQGNDGEDIVDGICFIAKSKLTMSPQGNAELVGMELREIADEYAESYNRKKEKDGQRD